MGKNLSFSINNTLYGGVPVKIERKKLYGSTKTIVYDEEGMECETARLDEGASGLIPKGGLGLGILSPDGLWVERSTLKAVNPNGKDAVFVSSSYDSAITLNKKVTAQDLLDHCITGFYELPFPGFASVIGQDIYSFEYCYRASYEPSSAFLLASDGSVFMLIGYKAEFESLGLAEEVFLDEDEIEEDDEEDIDFTNV